MVTDILNDWQIPFRQWAEQRERNPGPIPQKNILNPRELLDWLSHPSNWFDSHLYIVKYEGLTPKISKHHAWKLAPGCKDRYGLISVVFNCLNRRKNGSDVDEE